MTEKERIYLKDLATDEQLTMWNEFFTVVCLEHGTQRALVAFQNMRILAGLNPASIKPLPEVDDVVRRHKDRKDGE